MAASCFCGARGAGRGQFVKLVFPGGHVELLDRPVLAAEVMARHPRFCVARPDVFREPAGAVAGPDTMLHLGRKYYVVPKSTVRRLLKYSSSHSAGGGSGSVSLRRHLQASSASGGHDRGSKVGGGKKWFGWAVGTATGDSGDQAAKAPRRPPQEGASHGSSSEGEMVRRVCVKVVKEKGKEGKAANGGSPGRRRRRMQPSQGDSASFSWQPSLHSITEE